jgi:hypothetical protein
VVVGIFHWPLVARAQSHLVPGGIRYSVFASLFRAYIPIRSIGANVCEMKFY